MQHDADTGRIKQAEFVASPNCDQREAGAEPEVIIVHCISLPPGEYAQTNGNEIEAASNAAISRFFCNKLPPEEHSYYAEIAHLTVSSHFLIQRLGRLIQYVPTHQRAWHAGESVCLGRPKVNNFSIGIELEGLDTDINGFTQEQYQTLRALLSALRADYPEIKQNNIFAHSDIAPGRKPDPGPYFDWDRCLKA